MGQRKGEDSEERPHVGLRVSVEEQAWAYMADQMLYFGNISTTE
jgi:hypothetical protein